MSDPTTASLDAPSRFAWHDIAHGQALPVAAVRDDLIACPECDLLHAVPPGHPADELETRLARSKRHLRCARCDAPLGVARHRTFETPTALAVASLVALLIAHLEPVLAIDIQGQQRSATLWEAAWTLYDEDSWLVTGLVLFTTLVNPLVEALAVCYVLLPLRRGRVAPGFEIVLRAVVAVRPWVMVEVFMLGVLVAFVKLSSLAVVLPGAGLWAFAAAMLLMTATAWTFDFDHVWASTARLRQEAGRESSRSGVSPASSASSE
jgi:paraquat-inducible protein A